MPNAESSSWRNLALATFSFTLSFSAWGLISAFAPAFRTEYHLSGQATALLVAVPGPARDRLRDFQPDS